ncbi:MCE family protein [Actinocorallia longicatena]|uniref:MCE family protein n=1 Tax=Actinocorallia longicatena TaxID=111803 RepID=A0ABP6QNB1_9ACTN
MIGRTISIIATAIVAVIAVAVALLVWIGEGPGTRITAYFPLAIGVYHGSDVRILGVRVGRVDSVTAEGTRVKVVLTVDHGIDVPAEAGAVLVSPSVVSDRYVQLAPAYDAGAKMATGAVIPQERTRVPVELDQLYDSMKRLATQLGPQGANRTGSLSRLLQVGAANLDGNGEALRKMIGNFSKAAKTLSGSQDDIFATVDGLQRFTGMLSANDGQVRTAERQLADVSQFLAADRDELGAALKELATALVKVKDFIKDNRSLVRADVEKLAKITQTLVKQRRSLAEALNVLPLDVDNILNAYDPRTRSLMGRGNLLELMPLPAAGAAQ